MSRLLEGYRVIESAQLINGDRLGMILGDLGADVIKVESPFRGDYIRDFLGQITPHHSPAHLQLNKNKRSVALNLRTNEGREIFWTLLATADVFIDGNAADACSKLGIGYEEQRKRKPDIIYCQISGFGTSGPYADIPTHGQMMNALAASVWVEMGDDGFVVSERSSDRTPAGMGGDGSFTSPAYAAIYCAAALAQRARTGEGSYIDVSAADVVIANAFLPMTNALNAERIRDWSTMPQTGQQGGTKYQFYETKDGKFILFCGIEHHFWQNFCRAVGREDLITEQEISSSPVDFAGGDEQLRRELQAIFHTRTLDDWLDVARRHDIAMGPTLRSIEELQQDPHLAHRGIFVESEHPGAGPFTYVGETGIVAGQTYQVRYPAPQLGEHTEEILGDLGYSAGELNRWRSEHVIGGQPG
jgi:crotonobetainyl-CoA:carnitine CoA-transferase CaiB-like acyl-CoA transferase